MPNLSHNNGFRVLVESVWSRKASRGKNLVNLWWRDPAPTHWLYNIYTGNMIPCEAFIARFSAMNSRVRAALSAVKSPDARPDAIAWLEYSGLTVAKSSDCVIVGVDIYPATTEHRKKVAKRF